MLLRQCVVKFAPDSCAGTLRGIVCPGCRAQETDAPLAPCYGAQGQVQGNEPSMTVRPGQATAARRGEWTSWKDGQ